jgi:hypothetical protein
MVLRALAFLPLLALPARPAARGDDAADLLAQARAAALAVPRLHALVDVTDTAADGSETRRRIECWIDVKAERARTEVREWKKALPMLVVCGGPDALRFERLEVGEVAEQRGRYDLPTLLAASFAGELLAATFRGGLVTMKTTAYGKPAVAALDEKVGDEPCVRLRFAGNQDADLWIATRDHLPRRLRGAVPGHALDETVLKIESGFDAADVALEIPLVEGDRPLDALTAMRRWSNLPAEKTRWPNAGDPAPDFAAVDLRAQTRRLTETTDESALLAFWNAEDDAAVAAAARVEKAFADVHDPTFHFIHVAALSDRGPVDAAVRRHALRQEVWVAGTHEQSAYRRFHLWTTPLFVKVEDMEIAAITADPDEACRWARKR